MNMMVSDPLLTWGDGIVRDGERRVAYWKAGRNAMAGLVAWDAVAQAWRWVDGGPPEEVAA